MKLKIKFTTTDLEGEKKNYTKTFSQINEEADENSFVEFTEGYLSLIEKFNNSISYEIYKAHDDLIHESEIA